MRMQHKSLIPVLPREQLVAQWRELSAIAGNILTKGIPNHILVDRVIDYPLDEFITYAKYVRDEMTKRGYRTMDSVWNKIVSITDNYSIIDINDIYSDWMDDIYLKICYYNLYEKYLCNGIRQKDWDKISQIVKIS